MGRTQFSLDLIVLFFDALYILFRQGHKIAFIGQEGKDKSWTTAIIRIVIKTVGNNVKMVQDKDTAILIFTNKEQ